MWKKLTFFVSLMVVVGHSAWAYETPAVNSVYQYSALTGSRRAYLWIPPRCTYVRGVIMAMSNLTERAWLENPIIRQAAAEECLGIIWLGDGKDTPLDENVTAAGGDALDKLLQDLAKESGYKELAVAPMIAMGHSAHGNFSWNAAKLHPERVIAAIPIKTYPLPKSLGFVGVPLLYLVGETTEWPQFRDGSRPGDRDFFWPVVRDSAIALRTANQNNLIGVVTDPGGGHFDWSDRDARFVALYIHKACHYRLPKPTADGSRVKLNPIDPHTGWLTDTGGMDPERYPAAPYDAFHGDPKRAYWFFDEETARAAVAFEGDRKKRAKQMLTFVEDGKLVPVATRGSPSLGSIPRRMASPSRCMAVSYPSCRRSLLGRGRLSVTLPAQFSSKGSLDQSCKLGRIHFVFSSIAGRSTEPPGRRRARSGLLKNIRATVSIVTLSSPDKLSYRQ
jgi:hypothetical protein